eukprot:scaffold43684_cov52-Attheya_sp.AAC.3
MRTIPLLTYYFLATTNQNKGAGRDKSWHFYYPGNSQEEKVSLWGHELEAALEDSRDGTFVRAFVRVFIGDHVGGEVVTVGFCDRCCNGFSDELTEGAVLIGSAPDGALDAASDAAPDGALL